MAVHSDSWLLSLSYFKGARLDREGRCAQPVVSLPDVVRAVHVPLAPLWIAVVTKSFNELFATLGAVRLPSRQASVADCGVGAVRTLPDILTCCRAPSIDASCAPCPQGHVVSNDQRPADLLRGYLWTGKCQPCRHIGNGVQAGKRRSIPALA